MTRDKPLAIFRMFVRLLPSTFRNEFGPGILDVLREGYRRVCRRSWRHRVVFVSQAVLNLLGSAVRERLRPSMGTPRRRRRAVNSVLSSLTALCAAWTRDLRVAGRTLRHQPSFTVVVVTTLALGIGANSVVFTALQSVVLADLPYGSPDELVRLHLFRPGAEADPGSGSHDADWSEYFSEPLVNQLAQQSGLFSGLTVMATYREEGADLSVGDRVMRLAVFPVSYSYFEVLGVPPVVGRSFEAADQGTRAVVLNHAVWSQVFGSDPNILDETIQLDGLSYRVVGVMPRGFRNPLGYAADVWTLLDVRVRDWPDWEWENHKWGGIARLAPGLTIENAEQRLDALGATLLERAVVSSPMSVRFRSLRDDTVGSARTTVWFLMTAVGLLLFTACVNVASLFLVHNTRRSPEFALRAALGAKARDILGPLLAESLLLAGIGGLVGLTLAYGGVRALLIVAPKGLPRADEIAVGGDVLIFTALATVCTGVGFGLLPAWRLLRGEPALGIGRGRTVGTGAGIERTRLYGGLIVLQVATSLILLIGAGLLTKSFYTLRHVDLGIDPEGSLLFEVHLPDVRYPDAAARVAFHQRLHESIRGLPDVSQVGSIDWLPAHTRYHPWGFRRLDLPDAAAETRGPADARVVAGDYFEVTQLPLLRGRSFTARDTPDAPKVAVLSRQAMETRYLDDNVLGKPILVLGRRWTIVGVVEDVPFDPQGNTVPVVYLPHDQLADNRNWQLHQIVSTPRRPTDLVPSLESVLREIDPELVLYRPRPFVDAFIDVVAHERFATSLIVLFAAIAFTLAVVGVYGVVSYVANNRRYEIGIRLALGAGGGDVRGLVTRQALTLTGFGIVLGLAGARILTRWLESLVFVAESTDLSVFVIVAVSFAAVAWLAGLVPARRAARTELIGILRDGGR